MRILLDTHAFIWFCEDDPTLPLKTKRLIERKSNCVLISIASLWEIAIKHSIGRLDLNCPLEKLFRRIPENGFEILGSTPATSNI